MERVRQSLAGGEARAVVGTSWLVALAALVFVAGLLLAPAASRAGSLIALLFDWGCHGVCHRLPSRTLVTALGPMAVCARCFGLYAGGALGLLGAALLASAGRTPRPHPVLLLLVVPTALDALIHIATGGGLPNLPRAAISLPAGFALGLLLSHALQDFVLLRGRRRGKAELTTADALAVPRRRS